VIRRPVFIGVAALLLAGCSSTSPEPQSAAAAAPDDQPAQQVKAEPLTPERLQSLWWSWANSADPGPMADPTGQFCGDSQPFGVWLVAGTNGGTADRHCQVPATLPIAGPVIGHIAPDAAGCTKFLAEAKGEALLDDKPVPLTRTEPTRISYDTGGGSKDGYSCGLWMRIEPLSPGEHKLTLKGSSGTRTSEANYDLTVVRLP
jgi:hypothetical protein